MKLQIGVVICHNTPHVDQHRIGPHVLQGFHIYFHVEIGCVNLTKVGLHQAIGLIQPPIGILGRKGYCQQ